MEMGEGPLLFSVLVSLLVALLPSLLSSVKAVLDLSYWYNSCPSVESVPLVLRQHGFNADQELLPLKIGYVTYVGAFCAELIIGCCMTQQDIAAFPPVCPGCEAVNYLVC